MAVGCGGAGERLPLSSFGSRIRVSGGLKPASIEAEAPLSGH